MSLFSRDCAAVMLLQVALDELAFRGVPVLEEEGKGYRVVVRKAGCVEDCGPCWAARMAVRGGVRRDDWEAVELDAISLGYAGYELCPLGVVPEDGLTVFRDLRGL
ncbi:hypothetical protein JW921_11085 [Candidatus Fermentibacterales bacterium]|nr:hypothetical protein [Candidatus Fermentibacterales bacterium]